MPQRDTCQECRADEVGLSPNRGSSTAGQSATQAMAGRAAWRDGRLPDRVSARGVSCRKLGVKLTISITQEPHKHAHYVSLLRALSFRPASNGEAAEGDDAQVGDKRKAGNDQDEVDPGKDVIEDLIRAFRSWVEGREWLHMRLTVGWLSIISRCVISQTLMP